MITVSCRFAHELKIMCIPQPIIPVYAPPQPVTVLWSGSNDMIEVTYIRFLNGGVPEVFELWYLADDRVCEVHLYARVKLCSKFREDNFQTLFFNTQRFQIPFLGRRSLNDSVEFLNVVCTTQHVGSCFDYSPNIFVHSWGVNPTDTISVNVFNITRRAYDPIFYFRGFVLRSNHERFRLKRIELKRIRFEELLARIRQYVRDDVVDNACSPANNALGQRLSLRTDRKSVV